MHALLLLSAVAVGPLLGQTPPVGERCEGKGPSAPSSRWPAVVVEQQVYVQRDSKLYSPRVGVLQKGALVEVDGCAGPCDSPSTWVSLAGGGVVRRSSLRKQWKDEPDTMPRSFTYGTVLEGGAVVYERPSTDAGVVETESALRSLALLPNPWLQRRGWLKRSQGGYVQTSALELIKGSSFAGERDPVLPLAFAVRRTLRAVPRGETGPAAPVPRFERFGVTRVGLREVETRDGTMPRADLRIAFPRARPPGIPEGARWVHVDLHEQTLTAWEGDRVVYATLVSTGSTAPRHQPTAVGLHKVWLKSLHDTMRGEGYIVDEVPFVQFFKGGQALHGVVWHDWFGTPVSYGCVNMSLSDAKWVFEWAPPNMPMGWHTLLPSKADDALYVFVERGDPKRQWAPDEISTNARLCATEERNGSGPYWLSSPACGP